MSLKSYRRNHVLTGLFAFAGISATAVYMGRAFGPEMSSQRRVAGASDAISYVGSKTNGLAYGGLEASADPESMPAVSKARKIAVCGEDSLVHDTISNFQYEATAWYPGYAKVLANPHEALLAKVLLIQKAKVSIDISTYIFKVDEASNAYLDELRKALLRGVNVRFLVDEGGSIGEAITDRYSHIRALLLTEKEARAKGQKCGSVDLVIFHPLTRLRGIVSNIKDRFVDKVELKDRTAVNWDRRSHDKIFMIDKEIPQETIAIVGGRNIDNSYYGYPQIDEKTYVDMEIMIKNDMSGAETAIAAAAFTSALGASMAAIPGRVSPHMLANTLGQHYQNLFCSKGNRWLRLEHIDAILDKIPRVGPKLTDLPTKNAEKDLKNALETLLKPKEIQAVYDRMKGKSGFDYLDQNFHRASLHAANEIQNLKRKASEVLVDPNAQFNDTLHNGDSIYYQTRRLVSHAEKTVDICTPYIFLTKNERDCLKMWVSQKPGRRVRIISNSPATSDSVLALTTFERETAPDLMKSGPYACVDSKTKEISYGDFDNSDSKIQVYELGKLDNLLFANKGKKGWKPVVDADGHEVKLTEHYGKLHSKFGVVDGKFAFVGSDNFDMRSRHLNSETTFFIESEEVAAELTAEFEVLQNRSYMFGDPNLKIMLDRPEIRRKAKAMDALEWTFRKFPKSGFGN